MTKHISRNSTVALLFALLIASTGRTFTHFTSPTASVSQPTYDGNGPGGGDPYPPCPDCVVHALHLF